MPISAVVRSLGTHWEVVQERARAFSRSIPREGVTRSAYANAVITDIDPAYVDEVLRLLHRRGIAWVRRSRGDVRVYADRPESISLSRGDAATAMAELCSRIAGHMLALGMAEVARRTAQADGSHDAAEHGDRTTLHADRVLSIVRQHAAKGLCLSAVRTALPLTFAEPALSALVRWEPRLRPLSNADDLADAEIALAPRRIPSGLSLERKALALIAKKGIRGATRSDLMNSLRPKPKAVEIDALTTRLEANGEIVSATVRLQAVGRPGLRYFAASVGLPTIDHQGMAAFAG